LNGEPFVRYNLRALYPFAHQIVVVEGAVEGAAPSATADGHSTDRTLETLRRFTAHEDPDDKVEIVTRDGLWSEKGEMSQAYARRATGDYLWQVDIDEFYHPSDMKAVLDMLAANPTITAVSFEQIPFWGGFDTVVDGWYLRLGGQVFHRLFKWSRGYAYIAHRPPTVCDSKGRNLRSLQWISPETLTRQGIYLYHYGLVFPKQVIEKSHYYRSASWANHASKSEQWARESFLHLRHPYRLHNVYRYPSWLTRFDGTHPPQIEALRRDIAAGSIDTPMRQTTDLESLLSSRSYQLGRACLRTLTPMARLIIGVWRRLKSLTQETP
jgi:hypothetical protein